MAAASEIGGARGLPVSRIGRTGLEVTELGFGGAGVFCGQPRGVAERAFQAAWDAGIRYFDTAPFYGHGLSEDRMGDCLRPLPRESYVLSTKVGRLLRAGPSEQTPSSRAPGQLPFGIRLDYSHDGVLRSVEDSLQRLGLDRIDIAYIHDVSPHWLGEQYERRFAETIAGGYRALERLRAERTIRAFGVGVKDADVCMRFARAGDFDAFMLAGAYSLLNQTGLEELLPYCVERGISIVLAAPFNSGILATGAVPGATYYYQPAGPEIIARTARIEAICRRHGVELVSAALNFPLTHPTVASVVSGYASAAQVEANVRSFAQAPPDAFWADLKREGLVPEGAPIERRARGRRP
jgi:D-threo-aldose 1-dehydrogenase